MIKGGCEDDGKALVVNAVNSLEIRGFYFAPRLEKLV